MSQPLLDIATLIVRPAITIDGARYELRSPDELSVLDSHRCSIWACRIEELQKAGKESAELDELVDQLIDLVLLAVPDEIRAKLTGTHKLAVAEVFIALLLRSRMSTAGAIATAIGNPEIGAAFSRGFNDSTAASLGNGWWARLSRWFARTFG